MSIVVDASVVGCWCFPDESAVVAELALERLSPDGAVVPALWWFEVRNLLIANERRGRIDPAGTATFLAHLAKLPIAIDRAPDSAMIMALAREHHLTVYDAAYLELALRLGIPLATLDRALAAAAPSAGVDLLTDRRRGPTREA